AIHTSTYLGHPVGCAMALAQIAELRRLDLPRRAARMGRRIEAGLQALQHRFPHRVSRVSAVGLMAGIAWRRADGGPDTALSVDLMQEVLRRGVLLLPEGEHSEVTGITPPLTLTEAQWAQALRCLNGALDHLIGARIPA
ncbi:MAG: aminotransferase class III-fold pyridoxal phosphate-dependent enzyme, partial [Verrucomicrobiota bacterium]